MPEQKIPCRQPAGFTRLRLTVRKTLDLTETIDWIDDLVRRASACLPRQKAQTALIAERKANRALWLISVRLRV